jgi:prolyl 4-hydroxylase|tara:strand:- start:384 stop:980 length:597 start_codon:yes stop_codon:yes gene_type:complete
MKGKLIILVLILLVLYLLPTYPEPRVMKNFISEAERRHIISEASKTLETSTISHNKTVNEDIRKSETAWLSRDDKVVRNVINRCLKYTDRPITNCEKLQVLKYKPGGHYKPHQDAFKDDDNMRVHTFIIALNDGYKGGETIFPNLNKTYKLNAGDVLFFDTVDNYNLITSKSLHGGKTVEAGDKWICNLWVRKYPYDI